MGTRPAVFLDRDGTLIEDVGYLRRLDQIAVVPHAIEAVQRLSVAGFTIVVVSNQAGVARGYFDEPFVDTVHGILRDTFREGGAPIEAFYYCPHHPEGVVAGYRLACECRKPKPGLVLRAAKDLHLNLGRSFVVGDRWLDVELARHSGATGLLVRTGYGASDERHPVDGLRAAAIVDHVLDAARWIIARAHDGGVRA